MTRIVRREAIEQALAGIDLIARIEEGFAAYSAGRCNVPPIGELLMSKGEVHIKYGCITDAPTYVIKIASGFFDNPALGLPSGNGVMLVFSQETGALEAVLLDEGHLTDVRTAAAGAIAARHLALRSVTRIGILGTGLQARLQLEHLKPVTGCRDVLVFGRTPDHRAACRRDMEAMGFTARETADPKEVAGACRLIVTTTSAHAPLLMAADIRPGTHISAMGSDTPEKQELDAAIVARAARVVVDARAQCRLRGEVHHAIARGLIAEDRIEEIGEIILGKRPSRQSDDEITLFDSTGLAAQDIAIATAVTRQLAAAG